MYTPEIIKDVLLLSDLVILVATTLLLVCTWLVRPPHTCTQGEFKRCNMSPTLMSLDTALGHFDPINFAFIIWVPCITKHTQAMFWPDIYKIVFVVQISVKDIGV
jgi:hypothetical protein